MTARHPYFDLYLHDDAELAAALGSAVVARETLSEWPLSCVQRIRTADGRGVIYKAQAEPTVEPQFYAAARSPILVAATALPNPHGPAALLLEEVNAPRLSDLPVAPADAPRVVEAVLAAIAGIEGDLPALADLRSPQGLRAYVESMLDDLAALAAEGAFRLVTAEMVDALGRNPVSPRNRVSAGGYLHGDLRAENVFVRNRVSPQAIIDWQRPFYGPVDLDRATLLESLGADPLPIVGPEVMALLAVTRIAWLAACARRWFPPGVESYDAQIAALAVALTGSR
jgi:hypothetical protein